MVNVPRLQAELEFLAANPELFDPTIWAARTECGTVGCLAGWTVIHEGIPLDFLASGGDTGRTRNLGTIAEVAADILGFEDIDCDAADWLFAGCNSLHDLWRKASTLTDGAIQIPADLHGVAQ